MAVVGSTVALLGGIACSAGARDLPLPPGKPSLLLAVLALDAGRVVRASTVVDALWEEDPPASARALVHTYVSTLRRALDAPDAPRVDTVPGGYRLDLAPAAVDVHRVLAATTSDDPAQWRSALDAAAAPLLGGADPEFSRPWQVRLDAARDTLQDRLWAVRLDGDEAGSVLPEVRAAVAAEPLREDRVLLLARALGKLGRVDDALRTLDGFTRTLGEELGLDPSPSVPALRQTLIASAPSHEDEAPPAGTAPRPASTGRSSRRTVLLAALGTTAAVAAVLIAVAMRDDDDPTSGAAVTGPALISVDPADGSLGDIVELPIMPTQVEVMGDETWVRSDSDRAVALVSDGEARVTGLTEPPTSLAVVDGGAVVGLGFSGQTVTLRDGRVGAPAPAVDGVTGRLTLAADEGDLWVATIDGRLHPPDGRAGWDGPRDIGGAPYRLAVDGAQVWAVTTGSAELIAMDSSTAAPVRSVLRGEAADLSAAGGRAWVVTSGDERLWATSPTTGRVVATRVLPGRPTAVLATADSVWVALSSPPRLAAYDPDTLEPGLVVDLPREPTDLAFAGDRLLLALA